MEEKQKKNKRKGMIYLVIGLVALIALVAGATYAYFQAVTGNTATANLNATSGSTDNLTFTIEDLNVGTTKITDNDNTSKDIIINANQENFKEKGKSIGDGITGKAILVANNTTNKTIAYPYYVYVNITSNGLKYSSYTKEGDTKVYKTEEAKEADKENIEGYTGVPELVMVVKKNGSPYTEAIEGLTQTTITTEEGTRETGYDITEKSGAILISEETIQVKEEDEEDTKTDEWEISIVLVNLNTDQELNTGKKVTGEILIQKEEMSGTGSGGTSTGGDASSENISKLLTNANKADQTPTLYYHDGLSTDSESELEAGDYSYRYSGASDKVNNYVCFGGDCSNEPTNDNYANLYRIIGMFPTEETKDSEQKTYQLKIIKADYATEDELGGSTVGANGGKYSYDSSNYKGDISTYYPKMGGYYWNKQQNSSGDNTNYWSQSNLNTENLNKTYLNYIKGKDNEKWYNMIEEHTWITEGNTSANIYSQNAKNAYTNEITNPSVGTALSTAVKTYPARVGLMYVSDYMYAAAKENWTTLASSYSSAASKNWMYMGLNEWTITRRADLSNGAFYVNYTGYVNCNGVYSGLYAVRPVLFLNSSVKITSGDGTSESPYKLSM